MTIYFLIVNILIRKYGIVGEDVQPAKGGMFDNLEDVAKHLQDIGAKLDAPNDPKMAEVLGKLGVLKNSGEYVN